MPQSLLDKMNYSELESLATSRGIVFPPSSNSEDLRKAIHDWEVNKGLPFRGLRDLNEDKTNPEILELRNLITELQQRVEALENAK